MVQRPGCVDVDRSCWLLIVPIEIEHEFDTRLTEWPVVIRSSFETVTHGVVVDPKVEHLGEVTEELLVASTPRASKPDDPVRFAPGIEINT